MRLILRDISPDAGDAADPELEDGRLTLGRPPEHAVVERDGTSFHLVDKSRNGARVDGVDLGEGQRVRLRDGSHVVLADRQFRAEIVGDAPARPGANSGGAMPTISSILADVSPRGDSASGMVPGRRQEEEFDPPPMQRHRDRDVTIGYGAPPPTVSDILPSDWNSDFSSATEHVAATSTRVSLRTATPRAEAPAPRRAPAVDDDGLRAFLAGANIPLSAVGDDPAVLRRAGAMLAAAMRALLAAERDTQKLYADFDADTPIASTADLARLLLDEHGAEVLAGRFQSQHEAASGWQRAAAGIILAAADATPDAIRARVDAQGGGGWGGPEKRYWRAIVEANADAGVPVTPAARLTDALRRRTGGAA